MWEHIEIEKQEVFGLIKSKSIKFAGNKKLKIYGSLRCKSGKRMKKENRIFFTNEEDAISAGYRPCAHCLNKPYLNWKQITS